MSQNWSKNHIADEKPSNSWVTPILVIKNGHFGGKYIFETDYFDIQIANINDFETIQD